MSTASAAARLDIEHNLSGPVTPLASDSIAFLVMSLAGRLNRGASSYYLRNFRIGMADFRTVMALGRSDGVNVTEVALAADIDKAAASRSLKLLQSRGFVRMEQTSTRGRASLVHLTEAGHAFAHQLRHAARAREQRFVTSLSQDERTAAIQLIHKLIGNLPVMNRDCTAS